MYAFITEIFKNTTFQLESSNEIIYLENVEIKEVEVGWCAGYKKQALHQRAKPVFLLIPYILQ